MVWLPSWTHAQTLLTYPGFWNCLARLPTHQKTPGLPCMVDSPFCKSRLCSLTTILVPFACCVGVSHLSQWLGWAGFPLDLQKPRKSHQNLEEQGVFNKKPEKNLKPGEEFFLHAHVAFGVLKHVVLKCHDHILSVITISLYVRCLYVNFAWVNSTWWNLARIIFRPFQAFWFFCPFWVGQPMLSYWGWVTQQVKVNHKHFSFFSCVELPPPPSWQLNKGWLANSTWKFSKFLKWPKKYFAWMALRPHAMFSILVVVYHLMAGGNPPIFYVVTSCVVTFQSGYTLVIVFP